MAITNATLQKRIEKLQKWVHDPDGGKQLWDLITCLRGPDSPSEKGNGYGPENAKAYDARRKRKYRTVEVIRGVSGLHAGAARNRVDTKVTLPPQAEWDHFDRHVMKAAHVLGLEIKIEGQTESMSEGAIQAVVEE